MKANDGYDGPMNGTMRGFPLVPCRYHKLHHRSNEACPACYERKEGERKVEVLTKELAKVKAQLEKQRRRKQWNRTVTPWTGTSFRG